MLTAEQLIRKIRQCKTQQQEHAVILTELSAIRSNIKEAQSPYVVRNVEKIIYASMCGFSVQWGDMEIVKLLQAAKNHKEKRLAYLALSVVPHDNTMYLKMASNSIKMDLESGSQIRASLALQALAAVGTPEMLSELSSSTLQLCNHKDSIYLRKKALILAAKTVEVAPEISDSFIDSCIVALEENKNHNILLAGCQLAISLLKNNEQSQERIQKQLSSCCEKLNWLMTSTAGENMWQSINDPTLQCAFLQLIEQILITCKQLSENDFKQLMKTLNKIVSQPHRKSESAVGRTAIQFEAANVILHIKQDLFDTPERKESIEDLKASASDTLTAALSHRNQTIRYSALSNISEIIKQTNQTQGAQRHKDVVLNCMTEQSQVIRQRALDLLVLICDEDQAQYVVEQLLNLVILRTDDPSSGFISPDKQALNYDMIVEIVNSVSFICDQYIVNPSVQFRYLWQCCQLSQELSENTELLRKITSLCVQHKDLQKEFITQVSQTMKLLQDYPIKFTNVTLYSSGLFIIGECCQASENIEPVLQNIVSTTVLRYAVSAVAKIGVKNTKVRNICVQILQQLSLSPNSEIQQRASEYSIMINHPKAVQLLAPVNQAKKEKKKVEHNVYKKKPVALPQYIPQQNGELVQPQIEKKQPKQIQQQPIQQIQPVPVAKPQPLQPKKLTPMVPGQQKINAQSLFGQLEQQEQKQEQKQEEIKQVEQIQQQPLPQQQPEQPKQQTQNDILDDLFGGIDTPQQQQVQEPQKPIEKQIIKQVYTDENVSVVLQLHGTANKLEDEIKVRAQYAAAPQCQLQTQQASGMVISQQNPRITQNLSITGNNLGLKGSFQKQEIITLMNLYE